jgi:hypothetical protein
MATSGRGVSSEKAGEVFEIELVVRIVRRGRFPRSG